MSEENNTIQTTTSFKLLNDLIDQNPGLSETDILKLYQQKTKQQKKTIQLISNSIADNTSLLIESLNTTEKPLDPQSSAQYEIDSIINSGGQSDVYLAHRSDGAFEKTVAIKVSKNRYTDPIERAAFLKETQILAELQHPNIVNLIDAGFNQNDEPWIILGYIEGLHIDQFIESNKPSAHNTIQLLIDLSKALSYIHQQNIYHLDIKPANIMVRVINNDSQALLIDFGISTKQKIRKDNTDENIPILATTAFAAPEQLRKIHAKIDHRSDIYAFGKLIKHLIKQYPDIFKNNPDLNSVTDKATQTNPNDRYQDIRQLQTDLNHFKHNRSVSTRPLNFIQKFNKAVANKPLISSLIITFLLLISGLSVINWTQNNQAQKILENSQDYWKKADEIKNTSRILFLKPKQNIQSELNQLNQLFDDLYKNYQSESPEQKKSISLAVAEAGISLGRFFPAQEALLFAINASPDNTKVITHLTQNHLSLYQNGLQKNKQYSNKKTREAQADILYKRHVLPAQKLIKSLPPEVAAQNIISQSMVMYFNGNTQDAIETLQEKEQNELWPIPRLLQATQLLSEEARKFKVHKQQKNAALLWYQKAYNTIDRASEVARSHPDVLEKKCLLQVEIVTFNSAFNSKDLEKIHACEDLLIISPSGKSSLTVVSEAYINLAQAKFNIGNNPNYELERAVTLINQLNQFTDIKALANLLMGQINIIKANWKTSSKQNGLPELQHALANLKTAAELKPNDYLIQTEFANSLYKYANSIRPFNQTADDSYQQSVDILKQLFNHADATLFLYDTTVKILTNHGYYRYQNSLNADQQLNDAAEVLANMQKQWPNNTNLSSAQSDLHWTYAHYLVFQGRDPEPHLSLAIKAFDEVIDNQPPIWINRYNQISAMLSGITYYLSKFKNQSSQLQLVENKLTKLQQITTHDVDLSAHFGYYHNMMAINQMVNQSDPTPHLIASRKYNNQCLNSPFDRYSCLKQFATLVRIQNKWNIDQNTFNTQQWQADLKAIDAGLDEFPDHHQLMAQRAELRMIAVQNQQLTFKQIKQQLATAYEELNTVFKAQPLLSSRYQASLNLVNQLIKKHESSN